MNRANLNGLYAQLPTDTLVYEVVWFENGDTVFPPGKENAEISIPSTWQPAGSVLVFDPWK